MGNSDWGHTAGGGSKHRGAHLGGGYAHSWSSDVPGGSCGASKRVVSQTWRLRVSSDVIHAVVQRNTKVSRVSAIVFVPVLLVLLSLPHWGSRGMISMMIEFFFYLSVSQLWNLLAGYGGVVSLGLLAYIGLGGYMLFLFTAVLGVEPLLAIVISGIICALVSIPVAAL